MSETPSPMLRQPALFLGHGSPMTMLGNNPEYAALAELGRRLLVALPRPRAILCVTAHWETGRGQNGGADTGPASHLTIGEQPRTIHDFSGFPPELYTITYPAPGADWLVARVMELAGAKGVRGDASWGFDHGVYGVILPLLGDTGIPTVAMSLNRALSPQQHLALGAKLAPLRDEGVLLIGSGNIVHNLALYRQSLGTRPVWALGFQSRINAALLAGDTAALTDFAPDDEPARLAINSGEHYLPLLYAAGARLPGDGVAIFNDTVDGSLSMTSALFGDAALAEGL